jgi:NAD-dependent histone deacetylase SIR2
MNTKRGAAKGVSLSKRKAQPNAFDKLGDNPTEDEIKNAAANVALAELEERVADVRDSWETDSLFEDVFEELTTDSPSTDGKITRSLNNLPH